MDTAVLAQLNDYDPNVRKQAVMALGRSKDPAALPYLAAVVRTDPDPELRDLARKAGQYIQQATKGSSPGSAGVAPPIQPISTSPAPPAAKPPSEPKKPSAFTSNPIDEPDLGYLTRSYSDYEDEDAAALAALGLTTGAAEAATVETPAPTSTKTDKPGKTPVRGETYVVSEANQKRAKDVLEAALTANINNDNARAMRYLYQSLMLDPNLINDGYYAQIAGGVTQAPRDEAIQMIIDQGERKTFIKTQEKAIYVERKQKHLDETRKSNWLGVAIDSVIYLLINIGGPLAIFLAVSENIYQLGPELVAELDDAGVMAGFSFAVYFPVVLSSAAIAVVSLIFQAGLIHLIARYLLRGVGTFANLLTQLLRLYNRMFLIIYGLTFVGLLITIVSQGSPLMLCVMPFLIGATLYLAIKTLVVVGDAYDFGMLMGCLSVLGASLIIGLVGVALSWTAINAMLNTFMSMMPTTVP